MINFEFNDSPFFAANRKYCENIAAALEPLGAEVTGECNSYGYRVEAKWNRGGLAYKILFLKTQTTQDGVIIPKNANEYAGTELRVSGIPITYKISIGKGWLKRLLTPKKHRKILPDSLYLFSNHPSDRVVHGNLIPFVLEQDVSKFHLKNGEAMIKIHKPVREPLPIIENIEKVIRAIS